MISHISTDSIEIFSVSCYVCSYFYNTEKWESRRIRRMSSPSPLTLHCHLADLDPQSHFPAQTPYLWLYVTCSLHSCSILPFFFNWLKEDIQPIRSMPVPSRIPHQLLPSLLSLQPTLTFSHTEHFSDSFAAHLQHIWTMEKFRAI